MLLERLRERALAEATTLPPGYQLQPVRYVFDINDKGDLHGCTDTSDPKVHKRGKPEQTPFIKRTSGVTPQLLVDNAEYVLGIPRSEASKPERVANMHAAYKALVERCFEVTQEPAVSAVVAFLDRLDQVHLHIDASFDPKQNILFRVDLPNEARGVFPHELPSVIAFWQSTLADTKNVAGDQVPCIICGQLCAPLEVHPLKIKGIPGGQTGKDIVSANKSAFESYGLKRSHIAPTCADCAEAYGNALNALLANDETSLWTKELAYAFWATGNDADAVEFVGKAINTPEEKPEEVRALLTSFYTGRESSTHVSPSRFYAVSLGASGARVVVKDWIDTTVAEAKRMLGRYFALQQMVPVSPNDTAEFFPLWRLTGATVREKDTPLPVVSQSLVRLAIAGTPLPMDVLYLAVRRNRAEQNVTRARAALIKMVLASRARMTPEEVSRMAGLNREDQRPAYNCGRLLAVLDRIQYFAIGSANSSIIDRYYGSASSAPASVFGTLMHGAQAHMAKLRKTRGGLHYNTEVELENIASALQEFPKTLTMEEQGIFALGFYHQRASYRKHSEHETANGEESQVDQD